MKPTVGRIVHYTNLGDRDGKYPPEIQAAIITKVVDPWKDCPETERKEALAAATDEHRYIVSLKAFYSTGFFDMASVAFTSEVAGTDGARGKWTWPAREL